MCVRMLDEVLVQARKAKKKSLELRGSRHSRFGGTFVVHNQKSISGKERIFHKPISRKFKLVVLVECVLLY